jgi:hypothetical protein
MPDKFTSLELEPYDDKSSPTYFLENIKNG